MHLKRTVRQGYYRIVRHRFESPKDYGGEHTQLNETRFACVSAPAHKREQIRLTSLSHVGGSFSSAFPSVKYFRSPCWFLYSLHRGEFCHRRCCHF